MIKLMRLFLPLCLSTVLLAASETIPAQPRAIAEMKKKTGSNGEYHSACSLCGTIK